MIEANDQQLTRTVEKVRVATNGSLDGVEVAVWGLTFKAHTDDRRHSPAVEVVRRLLEAGAKVTAFDPTVVGPVPELPELRLAPSPIEACRGAAVLVVLTEWAELALIPPAEVGSVMAVLRVVDARNLLPWEAWRAADFEFRGIGYSP